MERGKHFLYDKINPAIAGATLCAALMLSPNALCEALCEDKQKKNKKKTKDEKIPTKVIQLELDYDGVEGKEDMPSHHLISGGIRKVGGDTTYSAIGKYIFNTGNLDDVAWLEAQSRHSFHFGKKKQQHLDALISLIVGTHKLRAGAAVGYRTKKFGAGVNYAFQNEKLNITNKDIVRDIQSNSHIFGGHVESTFGKKRGFQFTTKIGYHGSFKETEGYEKILASGKRNPLSLKQWDHTIYAQMLARNTDRKATLQDLFLTGFLNRRETNNLITKKTMTRDRWMFDAHALLKLRGKKTLKFDDDIHLALGASIGQEESILGDMYLQGGMRAKITLGEYMNIILTADHAVSPHINMVSSDAERVLREQQLARDLRYFSYKEFGVQYFNNRLNQTQEVLLDAALSQKISGPGRRLILGAKYRHIFESLDKKEIIGSLTWELKNYSGIQLRGGYSAGKNGVGALWGVSYRHLIDATD